MTTPDPLAIVQDAVAKGELDKLLLGEPGYRYLPKWSSAPGGTDLAALITLLYDNTATADRSQVCDDLARALDSIVGTYEGLDPVAGCILLETLRRAENRSPLGLPIEDLATRLRASIDAFRDRLTADRSGNGAGWANGRLDDLRRLSRNTEKYGGPSFCK